MKLCENDENANAKYESKKNEHCFIIKYNKISQGKYINLSMVHQLHKFSRIYSEEKDE